MQHDQDLHYESFTAPYGRALSLLKFNITSPVSETQTWLDHPTYNTKTDIVRHFTILHAQAAFVGRLFNTETPYPASVFRDAGYDYGLWRAVWEGLKNHRRNQSSDNLRLAIREYRQKGTPQ